MKITMKNWTYTPATALLQTISFPKSAFNSEYDILNRSIFFAWQLVLRVILKLCYQLNIHGQENIPHHGSYILISNHCSHFDTMCLLSVVPLSRITETYAAAAEDHFFVTRWKANIVNNLFHALPFSRFKTRETHQSLQQCKYLLSSRERTLIFFPEGQRSMNGVIQPFKRGIGFLLAGTHLKVIPVHIQGAHKAWPKANTLPGPGKLQVKIGKPLQFPNTPRTSRSYAHISTIIERELKTLTETPHHNGEYREKST